ncbi:MULTISPECIES: zinc-binding alcohol dehydrogenase family protein [Asticcacaulis]|uniref:zinc-binding alcohol dehydrogenase family protein n=1 Tax=Asticcacaulis TaxID=76890 RepID=UPI001AE65A27|nr:MULTISPECIES: zinc-binding alcohol dehydrogenase family protein [Asticcacaulis]MBP2158108.1 2-desacetyl-2-hydroxyethyl bacteriochlorophyllide A dehydrogenase [Asticcacaulis solisilvae]MDR6799153.1 2-desacetyl-2-hydroxyethyl bacteriochlorophyllide A dehydrogenase [Asticcacaulis sp. BE141]
MKAVVCEKPFELTVVDRPGPVRKDGEVMIRIRRVGLCGTDYHIFGGTQPFLSYPRVMGHELAGEVVDSDGGSSLQAGQLVTINPYLPCNRCIACRKGKPNCCVNVRVMGVHIDGGMTDFVCVPEAAVIPVPGLTPEEAAMVEFLSVGMHAVRRGAITETERVLVAGAGPIGVAVALLARLAGADVSLIDTSQTRLDYARTALGLPHTACVGPELDDWLRARTEGDYFDAVFDATGNAKAMEKGFGYVAHGGRYVLVSVVKDAITFADPEFHKREMQLIGSRNATHHDFRLVIDLIRAGELPTRALQTHAFALHDLPSVVPDLIDSRDGVLKAIASL